MLLFCEVRRTMFSNVNRIEGDGMAMEMDPDVKLIFDSWGKDSQKAGYEVRAVIFSLAEKTPGIGAIDETLKWNQPAYLTSETGSGSTIRMAEDRARDLFGVYFHCQTTLVETFRSHYEGVLRFEKNRAILLDPKEPLPIDALAHCIGLALRYHLDKKNP